MFRSEKQSRKRKRRAANVPPMSANLRSSNTTKCFRRAISCSCCAVRGVQSVTMSQCVLRMQMWSPSSSASARSSSDFRTSADRHRFVCLMVMSWRRYAASEPVEGSAARSRYDCVQVGCVMSCVCACVLRGRGGERRGERCNAVGGGERAM